MIKKLVRWYMQRILNECNEEIERLTDMLNGDNEYKGISRDIVNVTHSRDSIQRVLQILE